MSWLSHECTCKWSNNHYYIRFASTHNSGTLVSIILNRRLFDLPYQPRIYLRRAWSQLSAGQVFGKIVSKEMWIKSLNWLSVLFTVLFNPVFLIGSDILLLTLELKGLHNYERLVFISHIFARIFQQKATASLIFQKFRLYWILSGISMRIQLNLLNIQDTKRMELGVSCLRAIL